MLSRGPDDLDLGIKMDTLSAARRYKRRRSVLLAKPMFSQAKASIGHDIPNGWLDLIEKLVLDLEALPGGERLRCMQVKEKFGTLRFYLEGSAPRVDLIYSRQRVVTTKRTRTTEPSAASQLVAAAEQASAAICLSCGEPGTVVDTGGWWRALCPTCAEAERQT